MLVGEATLTQTLVFVDWLVGKANYCYSRANQSVVHMYSSVGFSSCGMTKLHGF